MSESVRDLKKRIAELEERFDLRKKNDHIDELHPIPRVYHGRTMNSKRINETEDNKAWFTRELDNMRRMFARFGLSQKMLEEYDGVNEKYAIAFGDCRRDYMTDTIIKMCGGDKFPLIREMREEYNRVSERARIDNPNNRLNAPVQKEPTREEYKASVYGMMYVHYVIGITPDSECLMSYFKEKFGDIPYDIKKIEEILPRELVLRVVESKADKKSDDEYEDRVSEPKKKIKVVGDITRIQCEMN